MEANIDRVKVPRSEAERRRGKGWGRRVTAPIRQAPEGAPMKVQIENSPDAIDMRSCETRRYEIVGPIGIGANRERSSVATP